MGSLEGTQGPRARPPPPHSCSRRGRATHLGCHEVGGVARCHEEPVLSPQLLGKAKVTDAQALRVPRLIHIQDVAGLEVPVHDLGAEGPGQFSMGQAAGGPGPLPGMGESEDGPREGAEGPRI